MSIIIPITFVAGALFALFFMALGPLFFPSRSDLEEYLDEEEDGK